jgi:hypothetical protein
MDGSGFELPAAHFYRFNLFIRPGPIMLFPSATFNRQQFTNTWLLPKAPVAWQRIRGILLPGRFPQEMWMFTLTIQSTPR